MNVRDDLENLSVFFFTLPKSLFQLPGFALFLLQKFLQVLCLITGFYHHRIKRMKRVPVPFSVVGWSNGL
jgi:hypothetical protein